MHITSTLCGFAVLASIVAAIPQPLSGSSILRRAPSPDNTCGNKGAGANKGYSCAASNAGPCCSTNGWCGATAAYCGTGCQPLFGTCTGVGTPTTTTTRPATTTSTTPPVTQPSQVVETDFTCGPTNGNKRCRAGYCCSQNGWCGTTAAYCGTGCNPLFGVCTAVNPTDPPPADGRCGPANGNRVCGGGQCCSPSGYCGIGADYCSSPDCLRGFGLCDADQTPSGASTENVARPKLGQVPYGVGFYDCNEPNTIALTFDDGPYIYTDKVLDLLDKYKAKATFFVTGINIGKGAIDDPTKPWRGMVSRMYATGHQLASHTWSHADLSTLDEPNRRSEMVKLEMALRNIIGKFPTYMRPPYSSCNANCQQTMNDLGYHITYFDFDTEDYLHTTAGTIGISLNVVTNLLALRPENYLSIMHDIHDTTANTLLEFFLKGLGVAGYRAVTVGECLGDPEANWYRS